MIKSSMLVFVLLVGTITVNAAPPLASEEAKQLGYCEGVYIYAAQMFQILGSNGAAINSLSRASRVVAASFFLNREGEVVPEERLQTGKLARRSVKPELDADPTYVATALEKCDKITVPLIMRASRAGGTLWGESLPELSQAMLV